MSTQALPDSDLLGPSSPSNGTAQQTVIVGTTASTSSSGGFVLGPGERAAPPGRRRLVHGPRRATEPPTVSRLFPHQPLIAVAYITGITLLVVVAACRITIACILRRRDRRAARAAAARYSQLMAAAAAAAEQEATYRAAHPVVLPVVILQPDGQFELAEKLEQDGQRAGVELADLRRLSSDAKAATPPIGFRPS